MVTTACQLQVPITGVTVTTNTPDGCTITFAASDFTNTPVLILTPINAGGGNPTSIVESENTDGTWSTSYTFGSAPPALVNFIASQLSS